MRTPGYEEELALGFLTSEGLLAGAEVVRVEYGDPGVMAEPDDSVLVRLSRRFDPSTVAQRNFVATASCGICGKASIDDVAIRCEPLPKGLPVVSRQVILGLPDALRAAQAAFERTGGLHASALFETDGRLVAIREDVGRHNALDKLIGHLARNGISGSDGAVIMTSRLSVELIQKTAKLGSGMLIGISAPTALAIDMATRAGMTLVALARGQDFEIFTGADRVKIGAEANAA
jgi:FdhD protein